MKCRHCHTADGIHEIEGVVKLLDEWVNVTLLICDDCYGRMFAEPIGFSVGNDGSFEIVD